MRVPPQAIGTQSCSCSNSADYVQGTSLTFTTAEEAIHFWCVEHSRRLRCFPFNHQEAHIVTTLSI